MLRTSLVTRYVEPLREGGSLPALVEADDEFYYVMKFKGAGQGSKALCAEIICGELARKLGFKVPELVFLQLDERFGQSEGDEEIQDLLKFSVGLNLGLHFLSGSITYDPAVSQISSYEASKIVWLDAFITNIDRTAKNTNMLMWHNDLWLIDHGAALYFHHSITDVKLQAKNAFPLISNHVLLPYANDIAKVHEEFKPLITVGVIQEINSLLPDEWLIPNETVTSPEEWRKVYETFLNERLQHSDIFYNQILDAKAHI